MTMGRRGKVSNSLPKLRLLLLPFSDGMRQLGISAETEGRLAAKAFGVHKKKKKKIIGLVIGRGEE